MSPRSPRIDPTQVRTLVDNVTTEQRELLFEFVRDFVQHTHSYGGARSATNNWYFVEMLEAILHRAPSGARRFSGGNYIQDYLYQKYPEGHPIWQYIERSAPN